MTASTTASRPAPTAPLELNSLAPRRRSPKLIVLAILLIALGVVAAGVTALKFGATHEFIALARPVQAGHQIAREDLLTVRITLAPGLTPVDASAIERVVGRYATMPLAAGTLLTKDQVTDHPIPGPGKQLVGLKLGADRMPAGHLVSGSPVLLVVLPDPNAADPQPGDDFTAPRTITGNVVDVTPDPNDASVTILNVTVADAEAPFIVTLAGASRIGVSMAGS